MKILLVVFLAFHWSCLLNTIVHAETQPELKLTPAEKYVLEQINKGEVADFKESENFGSAFQEIFSKIEDRTLSADFLKALLTGTLPNLKVTEKGVRIRNECSPSDTIYRV